MNQFPFVGYTLTRGKNTGGALPGPVVGCRLESSERRGHNSLSNPASAAAAAPHSCAMGDTAAAGERVGTMKGAAGAGGRRARREKLGEGSEDRCMCNLTCLSSAAAPRGCRAAGVAGITVESRQPAAPRAPAAGGRVGGRAAAALLPPTLASLTLPCTAPPPPPPPCLPPVPQLMSIRPSSEECAEFNIAPV